MKNLKENLGDSKPSIPSMNEKGYKNQKMRPIKTGDNYEKQDWDELNFT